MAHRQGPWLISGLALTLLPSVPLISVAQRGLASSPAEGVLQTPVRVDGFSHFPSAPGSRSDPVEGSRWYSVLVGGVRPHSRHTESRS